VWRAEGEGNMVIKKGKPVATILPDEHTAFGRELVEAGHDIWTSRNYCTT